MVTPMGEEEGSTMTLRRIAPQVAITHVDTSRDREQRGQKSDGGWTHITCECGHVSKGAPHFSYKIGEKRKCFQCQEALDKQETRG